MATHPALARERTPAIWVGLVLVALLASTSLLGRPLGYPDTGAAAWLPPDGSRQRYVGPGGTVATEWALDQAFSLVLSGPPPFFTWLGQTAVPWQTAAVARLSSVYESASGEVLGREDDLFSVTADGVRAEAEAPSSGASRVYLPGRLDVPSSMSAGRSWTSSGVVVQTAAAVAKKLAYRAVYSARTPADPALIPRGCLEVTMSLTVGTTDAETSERTWCRHAGILSFVTPDGAWQPVGARPAVAVEPDPGLDWSRADQLAFTARTFNRVQVGAPVSVQVTPVGVPGVLPDGTLVFANVVAQDTLALDSSVEPPTVTWRSRAGGRNTATGTFGGVTVVAGSSRMLVAYGTSGQWLWQQRLSDLTIATPARMGDLLVVPTLDGAVTAYDLATGALRWHYMSSAEIRVSPVVATDRVLVVDQAGQLTCLDASGTPVWTVDVGSGVSHFAVWAGAGAQAPLVVVSQDPSSHLEALSLADGSRLWRVRELLHGRDVISLDRVVVLRDNDETAAVDPLTGTRVWTWRATRTFAGIGGGSRVLLLAADHLVLLDDAGAPVREWPVEAGDVTGASVRLTASQQRVVVYGTTVELGVLP